MGCGISTRTHTKHILARAYIEHLRTRSLVSKDHLAENITVPTLAVSFRSVTSMDAAHFRPFRLETLLYKA